MHSALSRGNRQLAPSYVFDELRLAVLSDYVSNDDSQILLRDRMVLVDFCSDASSFGCIDASVLDGNVKTECEPQLVLHVELLSVVVRYIEELLRALKLNRLNGRIAA